MWVDGGEVMNTIYYLFQQIVHNSCSCLEFQPITGQQAIHLRSLCCGGEDYNSNASHYHHQSAILRTWTYLCHVGRSRRLSVVVDIIFSSREYFHLHCIIILNLSTTALP